jgi:hypothetical protein
MEKNNQDLAKTQQKKVMEAKTHLQIIPAAAYCC